MRVTPVSEVHDAVSTQMALFPKYDWARDLLVKGFRDRITAYLTPDRIKRKIREKHSNSDVLYESMLRSGAGRDHYVSMLTYWSVGQGIAVSMRNWIEELIKELVLHPKNQSNFGRPIAAVYTLKDLKRINHFDEADAVATAGESETEHSQNRAWEVKMRSSLIDSADLLSECFFRAYARRKIAGFGDPRYIPRFQQRFADDIDRFLDDNDVWDLDFQHRTLLEKALDTRRDGFQKQRIICNLMVLEKPPGKIKAFRFASPGLSSIRQLKDEKRNLLLLYGWLRQEKPFRMDTDAVEVYWTHLFPRKIAFAQQYFFHTAETKTDSQFWEFVGVPFEVVAESLRIAGSLLGERIGGLIRTVSFPSIRKQLGDETALG